MTADPSGSQTLPIQASITLPDSSVTPGNDIILILEPPPPVTNISVELVRVERDDDVLAFGQGFTVDANARVARVVMRPEVPEGIYAVVIRDSSGTVLYPNQLFIELARPDRARPRAEILADVRTIFEARETEFARGYGDASIAKTFRVHVLIGDLLTHTRLRLDRVSVYPCPAQGLMQIEEFVEVVTGTRIRLSPALAGRYPRTILEFPWVHANDDDAALAIVSAEVSHILDAFAAFRYGYPTATAAVIIDNDTGRFKVSALAPAYRGNLLGGALGGEDPQQLKLVVRTVKQAPDIALYLNLFRLALAEHKLEFAYFRFWSLLETIARQEVAPTDGMLDWNGQPAFNPQGQQRQVTGEALPLVTQIIRRIFVASGISEQWDINGTARSLDDLIPIWYRHRNCVGHTGRCDPADDNLCRRGQARFDRCRNMHESIVQIRGRRDLSTDDCFTALRDTAMLVVMNLMSIRARALGLM